MATKNNTKVVPSICSNCMTQCGISAHVEDGKVVKVTPLRGHPFSTLCIKGQAIPDMIYAKDRITHPLKRVNGDWKKISADEAFDIIAGKLNETKEKYGDKALAMYVGLGFHAHSRFASRFASVYGTPNYSSGTSNCAGACMVGQGVTLDRHGIMLREDFEASHCVIVWGTNLHHSDLQRASRIEAAKKKGAKLIVIDPRRTRLAKEADIYTQIRPGTDCALALGLLNVIIAEELYDKDFVKDWTVGFDELREHVKQYTPEAVEEISWVPAKTIKEIARMYATNKPAAIAQYWSLEHCASGVQHQRAVAILMAITGNLNVDGGNIYYPMFRMKRMKTEGGPSLSTAVGGIRWPLFVRVIGEDQGLALPDAIIDGEPYPIKVLICQSGNPGTSFPNTRRVQEALEKLDFLVVHDYYLTETAKFADIFLPAVFPTEQEVLFDYSLQGAPWLFLARKAVDPPEGCIHDWRLWIELAQRMGYSTYFPWQSEHEFYEDLLESASVSLKELMEHPAGVWHHDPKERQQYLKKGFSTGSGKVEILSQALKDYGYDPLPTFIEPRESLISRPDLAQRYPFILLNGTREAVFCNSQHHNIPKLLKRVPEPLVEINDGAAKERGIVNDDMVVVESPYGSIRMRAKVTDDIHPKVVSIPKGWPQANGNLLIGEGDRDPITGYYGFRTQLCQVRKADL